MDVLKSLSVKKFFFFLWSKFVDKISFKKKFVDKINYGKRGEKRKEILILITCHIFFNYIQTSIFFLHLMLSKVQN